MVFRVVQINSVICWLMTYQSIMGGFEYLKDYASTDGGGKFL